MRDIVVGRLRSDVEKQGLKGTILLGKQYIHMGRTTTLSNNIYLDVAGSHVMFICGKRGGGKSYAMGVIAEGVADLEPEVKQNLAFIFLDTMGVYWTMKYPNKQEEELLEPWGIKAKPCDITIFTPIDYYYKNKEQGIPTDKPFAIQPNLLDGRDWCHIFDLHENSPHGIAITRISYELKKLKQVFSIRELIDAVQQDDRTEQTVKDALENMLLSTESWGVFDLKGTDLAELAKGGQISVLDVSAYATLPGGWRIKQMIVGLISQKLFIDRMKARKKEEYEQVYSTMNYFSTQTITKQETPLVWLVLDEAHEFVPKNREDWNIATEPIVTIMREGRQPGISLILSTQQPGKIHTDVMTQADIVLSTRLTARLDVDALGTVAQSYMKEGLVVELDNLPRVKGAAIIFDDANEKLYPLRVRPRYTWHAGGSPSAIKEKKKM